jgi:hypothetical protein
MGVQNPIEDKELIEIAREIIKLCRSKWDPNDNNTRNMVINLVNEFLYNTIVNRNHTRKISHFYNTEEPIAMAIECGQEEEDLDVWLYYQHTSVYLGILIEGNKIYVETG